MNFCYLSLIVPHSFMNFCSWLFFQTARYGVEVGLEDGKIPNRAFTASSKWDTYHRADRARLNTVATKRYRGAWSAKKNNRRQWIQVKLGRRTRITGVVTQGRQDANQWVTSYSISHSLNGRTFRPYKESGRVKVTFQFCLLYTWRISWNISLLGKIYQGRSRQSVYAVKHSCSCSIICLPSA